MREGGNSFRCTGPKVGGCVAGTGQGGGLKHACADPENISSRPMLIHGVTPIHSSLCLFPDSFPCPLQESQGEI